MKTSEWMLKLCVIVTLWVVVACSGGPAAQGWAKAACKAVEAMPEASASSLPPGTQVHVVASESSVHTIVVVSDAGAAEASADAEAGSGMTAERGP